MPKGDRTGPQGMGPKTGRAMGYCTGHPNPGYMNHHHAAPLMGRRGCCGHGHGWRNEYCESDRPYAARQQQNFDIPPASPEEEIAMLQNEAKNLQNTIKNIEKRIADLSKEKE